MAVMGKTRHSTKRRAGRVNARGRADRQEEQRLVAQVAYILPAQGGETHASMSVGVADA